MFQRSLEQRLPPHLITQAARTATLRSAYAIVVANVLWVPAVVMMVRNSASALAPWWIGLALACAATAFVMCATIIMRHLTMLRVATWVFLFLLPVGYLTESMARIEVNPSTAWQLPLLWNLEPAAILAATLIVARPLAYVYGIFSVTCVPIAAVAAGAPMTLTLLGTISLHIGNLCFIVVGETIYRQMFSRELSHELEHMRVAAAEQARAWHNERTRVNAFIHDEVLSTLLSIVHGRPADEAQLRQRARDVVNLLDETNTTEASTAPLSVEAFSERLSLVSRRYGGRFIAQNQCAPDGASGQDIPASVGEVLLAAATQALENSLNHSPGCQITVTAGATERGFDVTIADDGPGFDVAQIHGRRMGIRMGIVGRMASIPGGSAQIASDSSGTRMTLSWDRTVGKDGQRRAHMVDRDDEEFERYAVQMSGPASTSLRIMLMVIWVIGSILAIVAAHQGLTPVNIASAAILGATCLAVTTKNVHPGVWFPAVVLLNTSVATAVTLLALTSFPVSQPWLWQMSGDMCGLAAMRGKTRVAWGGFLIQTSGLLMWMSIHGGVSSAELVSAFAYALSVIAGLSWNYVVRRNLTTIYARLNGAARATIRENAAHDATEHSSSVIATVRSRAGDALATMADPGTILSESFRNQCAVVEATVRDVIRAPRLAIAPFDSVCHEARQRGVTVDLYDDGDESEPIATEILAQVSEYTQSAVAQGAQHILVRALPPGRSPLLVFRAEGIPESSRSSGNDESPRVIRHSWDSLRVTD